MTSIFSKLFGTRAKSPESGAVQPRIPESRKQAGRRDPPTELDWSHAEYVPLPPAPPTWEVDGREEFHREYSDPVLGPVLSAGFEGHHTKVLKLAVALSPEQRQGKVGPVVAQAHRKVIIQRMKAGQLMAAAKQSLEMFEQSPGYVQDVDKRRFNRILATMDKEGKEHNFEQIEVASPSGEPLFTVSNGPSWVLEGERKLHDEERPDPSILGDVVAFGATGTWILGQTGGSASQPSVKTVLRRLDRFGNPLTEKVLGHDAYRTGGATGESFAIMDSSGVLHVYDAAMKLILETSLSEDRRVTEHFRTIDTHYWGDFKSQVRAVDVYPEGDRYLFTLADECWCCGLDGRATWGVAMPLRDGWKRVVKRSTHFGVGRELDEALSLFGLSLPVSPADIKRRYRSLARAHHPDQHPDDPHSAEKMKALNLAFEVLTGVDPNALAFEDSDTTYFARVEPDHVVEALGVRIEITIDGGVPQDWVYAASFAAANGGAYVATYSGKVILISSEGRALAVYDIGTCPNQIVSSGRYTYFLTSTRLYVIEDGNKLSAFLDVFHQGRLIVAPTGFGLLASKMLQWFTVDGKKVGELTTRDPIRAVYAADGGAVVKTRQHQVEVQGLML